MDSLYSALVIDADQPGGTMPWRLFDYGIAQPITLHTRPAMRIHTNVPRTGGSGLPMNWSHRVSRWRATTTLRTNRTGLERAMPDLVGAREVIRDTFLEGDDATAIAMIRELDGALLEPQVVLDWAATCSAAFWYNGRPVVTTTLLDLLHQPHALSTSTRLVDRGNRMSPASPVSTDPFVHILENMSFEVVIEPQGRGTEAYDRLRTWLGANTASKSMTLWVWLEGNLVRDVY